MKRFIVFGFVICALTILYNSMLAQTEDIREATGLPIQIGQPVIFGHVKVRGLAPGEKKPTIHVSLFIAGVHVERARTNDRDYYYFLRSAADAATLVFEANGVEVGRAVLNASVGTVVRRDIEIDLRSAARNDTSAPGVISVKGAYARTPKADEVFNKALSAAREKRSDLAATLLKSIVEKDPKDYVAWTELGTVYFGNNKFADAENAYVKALELKPDFELALMNLGRLRFSQKNFEGAIVTFTKAASSNRGSADAFHYLGESYLQIKQGSKAVIALNEAIRLAPTAKAELHLRLGALYNAAGMKDRAANEYKLFLIKKPNYIDKERLEIYIRENSR